MIDAALADVILIVIILALSMIFPSLYPAVIRNAMILALAGSIISHVASFLCGLVRDKLH